MSIKIPLITGISGIIATVVPVVLSSTNGTTTKNDDLHNIQVYFYDKESQTKTMRMTLSLPFAYSSMEFPKQDETNSNKWEKLEDSISSETEEDNKTKKRAMWNTLFGIASKYIHTQHQLNIIKVQKRENTGEQDKLKNLCKDGNCCCKKPGQSCDCSKGNCCKMCLCCYSKDSAGNCCCKDPNQTNCYDDLIKSQKTFQYLMPNIDSAWTGRYLQPVEAHIKLPNLQFSDLEISDSDQTSSNSEQKPFIGTLVYGFVDYWYKEGSYKEALPKDSSASYSTLTDGTKYWFANVPQRFTFTHKKKQNDSSASTSSNTENIETILKVVESSQGVNKFVTDTQSDPQSCCTNKKDTDEVIKCLLSRNYIYLETTSIKDTPENMKNIGDCCSG